MQGGIPLKIDIRISESKNKNDSNQEKLSSKDPRIHAYQKISEVNQVLNEIMVTFLEEGDSLRVQLHEIQKLILAIQNDLTISRKLRHYTVNQSHVLAVECLIAQQERRQSKNHSNDVLGEESLLTACHQLTQLMIEAEEEMMKLITRGQVINLHTYKIMAPLSEYFSLLAVSLSTKQGDLIKN